MRFKLQKIAILEIKLSPNRRIAENYQTYKSKHGNCLHFYLCDQSLHIEHRDVHNNIQGSSNHQKQSSIE